eukprot:TRINITY_DN33065_c0_g1_i1.p1 TRINITY_DN33065_c0_g1~~TRINITY_DN33065_c0_g1_i1.p1  ORF type:complete len:499 (+),score=68.55 TRINITY_DN33065_c0_g1_i1:82-1578(+)
MNLFQRRLATSLTLAVKMQAVLVLALYASDQESNSPNAALSRADTPARYLSLVQVKSRSLSHGKKPGNNSEIDVESDEPVGKRDAVSKTHHASESERRANGVLKGGKSSHGNHSKIRSSEQAAFVRGNGNKTKTKEEIEPTNRIAQLIPETGPLYYRIGRRCVDVMNEYIAIAKEYAGSGVSFGVATVAFVAMILFTGCCLMSLDQSDHDIDSRPMSMRNLERKGVPVGSSPGGLPTWQSLPPMSPSFRHLDAVAAQSTRCLTSPSQRNLASLTPTARGPPVAGRFCPELIVPNGSDYVLRVPTAPLRSGNLDITLPGGQTVVRAVVSELPVPKHAGKEDVVVWRLLLRAASENGCVLGQCCATSSRGNLEYHIHRSDGSHYGKLARSGVGEDLIMTTRDGVIKCMFKGNLESQAMCVVDGPGNLLATVEPCPQGFSGPSALVVLKAAPQSDVGLILCTLYCTARMARKTTISTSSSSRKKDNNRSASKKRDRAAQKK